MHAWASAWLATSARFAISTDWSASRVVITCMPRAPSRERSRTLSASVAFFSYCPLVSQPPVSSPPCAASSTTTNCAGAAGGPGGACCAAGSGPMIPANPAAANRAAIQLVQRINGETAQQLGIEIGGLLRHHFARERHFPQLLHGPGIGKEGDVGFIFANLVN